MIKLKHRNLGELLVEIENKRRKLYDIYLFEPHKTGKLVKASQELDELINEYQQKAFPKQKAGNMFV